MLYKFNDNPTVNESEIVIFLRQVWWPAEKRGFWERKREKNEIGRQRRLRSPSEN